MGDVPLQCFVNEHLIGGTRCTQGYQRKKYADRVYQTKRLLDKVILYLDKFILLDKFRTQLYKHGLEILEFDI